MKVQNSYIAMLATSVTHARLDTWKQLIPNKRKLAETKLEDQRRNMMEKEQVGLEQEIQERQNKLVKIDLDQEIQNKRVKSYEKDIESLENEIVNLPLKVEQNRQQKMDKLQQLQQKVKFVIDHYENHYNWYGRVPETQQTVNQHKQKLKFMKEEDYDKLDKFLQIPPKDRKPFLEQKNLNQKQDKRRRRGY
jgi:hypothetical protein